MFFFALGQFLCYINNEKGEIIYMNKIYEETKFLMKKYGN